MPLCETRFWLTWADRPEGGMLSTRIYWICVHPRKAGSAVSSSKRCLIITAGNLLMIWVCIRSPCQDLAWCFTYCALVSDLSPRWWKWEQCPLRFCMAFMIWVTTASNASASDLLIKYGINYIAAAWWKTMMSDAIQKLCANWNWVTKGFWNSISSELASLWLSSPHYVGHDRYFMVVHRQAGRSCSRMLFLTVIHSTEHC